MVNRLASQRTACGAEAIALLAPDEQHRLTRLRCRQDQERYVLARSALRLLLGFWLQRDPASLRFTYGCHGKPALVDAGPEAPHFNLAHSGELILLAFHPARPVGVDVERQRPGLDWLPIARRVLSAADVEWIAALPAETGAAAFLEAWCRLEARLKASGEGLVGLERLQRQDACSLRVPLLWNVAVPVGYRAAVALAPLP